MEAKNVFSQKAFNEQKMQKVNLFETERMFCDLYCFEPARSKRRTRMPAPIKFTMFSKVVAPSISVGRIESCRSIP